MQEKIAMTQTTKCVETIAVVVAATIIVLTNKEMFFEKIKRKKKTELCKNYELYKDCYYGDNCSFAHGIDELRENALLPSYKTKLCKSFEENNVCNFGIRCSYQHKIK